MISFGERCYSNQYDEISDDEFSDDEITGFANTTKLLTTKFLTTKFLTTKFLATKNTYLYQKSWRFFPGKSEKPGKIVVIRMRMRRNQASIAEKPFACKKKKYLRYAKI